MVKKVINFDNAATSFYKPNCVKRTLSKSLKTSANPGRSGHKLSLKNAFEVFNTRQTIANHFNCPNPNLVIFTKNCTEALNLAILGLLNNKQDNTETKSVLKEKKHIICSCFEHNSILRPLTYLQNQDLIDLTIVYPENKEKIMLDDIKKVVKSNTYLVCLTHISNVTGVENDVESIGKFCKKYNIIFLLDCAQSAGHVKIDMQKININFLAFAGHKGFLAPQGIGALCINSTILPHPINFGGTGTNSINLTQPKEPPECFESGTLMTPNIISLNAGIKYVEKHFVKNNLKLKFLTQYLIKKLKSLEDKKFLTLYSPVSIKSGVISFNLKNLDSNEVAQKLDEQFNIAVRSGLHCAPLTHKFLGTTQTGTVRVSLSFKNTKRQINKFIKALIEIYNNSQIW